MAEQDTKHQVKNSCNSGEEGGVVLQGSDDHRNSKSTRGTGVSPVNHGRDGRATLRIRRGANLPHWTKEGSIYSVTFRLGDSLPRSVLESWLFERETILNAARRTGRSLTAKLQKRLDQLHTEKVEKYLDSGYGKCWMKDDRIAGIVATSLIHFDGERYDLFVWCVMPNHVHAVLKPFQGHQLPEILHSWKSFSAHQSNKILRRAGRFWQPEYYDHLIRSQDDLCRRITYVLTNPEQAGLKNWKWIGGKSVSPTQRFQDDRAIRRS